MCRRCSKVCAKHTLKPPIDKSILMKEAKQWLLALVAKISPDAIKIPAPRCSTFLVVGLTAAFCLAATWLFALRYTSLFRAIMVTH